jgi:chromate reductase, NAD(P)H dehydrogenase (quinone)
MKMLAFAASTRRGSLNDKLVQVAARFAADAGADVDVAAFRDFTMPMYEDDLERSDGLPPGALELKRRLAAADAVMIATPEYNYSIPGALKNAIDWVSRARPMPWRGKSVYLLSASPSGVGGMRGLWHTRVPLEGCGALVFPDMFSLAHANDAFDDDGELRDAATRERLVREVRGFVRLAEAVVPVCSGRPARGVDGERRREIAAALEQESEVQPAPH